MASETLKPVSKLRLEPLTASHLGDIHKLLSNERVARFSSRPVSTSLEQSREFLQQRLLAAPGSAKPWALTRAIMVPKEDSDDGSEELAGVVTTTRPSPSGLLMAYSLREECWGRGYATAAVQQFLDEYWSEPRKGPRKELYDEYSRLGQRVERSPDEPEDPAGDEELDIGHLVAEVDAENPGSLRVMEKCGGVVIGSVDAKLFRFEDLRRQVIWKLNKPK